MLWVYVLLLTLGVVLAVPNLARVAADAGPDRVQSAIGAFGLAAGAIGLVLGFTRAGGGTTFAVAVVVGLAAAAATAEGRRASRTGSTLSQ